MINHGKFHSLTLINWNGFFARTFELDNLVTTLSGGNGAGKSTTMAAFVTALIPDLTLLHFRNTTEAGATGGSRDKGLHGKLKPGVCYSLLEVINSKNQKVICGVRLQQIAGRDKKVDIKTFIVEGLDESVSPIDIVTHRIDDTKARILSLTELKEKLEGDENVTIKQFSAISDYHSVMFDLGVLPKRLRTPSDRSKYYKLIEASLYGGISSAITRSLRDYLLPENSGVKKAFGDMEAALRENRMTLEAIKTTQSDRDLFKHLITESTNYVASDYMRNINERRNQIEQALSARKTLFAKKQQLLDAQHKQVELAKALHDNVEKQKVLDESYQAANEHLNLMQNVHRQQEKIEKYQEELEIVEEKLLEQSELVEQANDLFLTQQEQSEAAEIEVDEIKTQLGNYQQALDVQQTRSIQYKQAHEALAIAKDKCNLDDLNENNAAKVLADYKNKSADVTKQVLALSQKLSVTKAAEDQFELAYQLVKKLDESADRANAYNAAKKVLKEWQATVYESQKIGSLNEQVQSLSQKMAELQKASSLFDNIKQKLGKEITFDQIDEYKESLDEALETYDEKVQESSENRIIIKQKREHIQTQIEQLQKEAPAWLKAQDELNQLSEKLATELTSQQQVTERLQQLLEQERQLITERDRAAVKRDECDEKITQLNQPSGADDGRLALLAEKFNGVLLSEIYEDVTIEDAPYFSALYGPSRHAIVVPSLEAIKPMLAELDDCPEDLYFIEGDPSAFDDSVFDSEELTKAVLVKTASRQWRYSSFPAVPLFGRAAREQQLEKITSEKETLQESYAHLSFELQKNQRMQQHISQFIGEYLSIAFTDDPERKIQTLLAKRHEIERELSHYESQDKQHQQKVIEVKSQLAQLNELTAYTHVLADTGLASRLVQLQNELKLAQKARDYVNANQQIIAQLEPIVFVLERDPTDDDNLNAQYQNLTSTQQTLQEQIFALTEVVNRLPHFSYIDAINMVNEDSDLNEQLRLRLETVEKLKQEAKQKTQQYQAAYQTHNQTLIALKSERDAKQKFLFDLRKEIEQIGVALDQRGVDKAVAKRDDILHQIQQNREQITSLEKQLVMCENDMTQSQKAVYSLQKEHQILRKLIVDTKIERSAVLLLVKQNHIEKRLHKRELAYLSAEELRSMSDKALGSLRLAVSDNEHLRDALTASEGAAKIEKKVQFYLCMFEHLRQRIRQDMIKTDDPIDAIEQMEIELSRLTNELTAREHQLAISSQSVANIIKKTILREQQRVRMLNQGLQSVGFGQVSGVRLNVNIKTAHQTLLDALALQDESHQDLFNNQQISFSQALAKLYQRLNPHIDFGQKNPQTIGESLLDYRNYLELDIEVHRGADGWLKAESGALSTGEAIGTGMSILLMVIQSWEEESKRLRNKEIIPCRLLFLDEAARLDAKSIATLFELCEKLSMQLIIAAPENISPEKGTTYKLVRKIVNNNEYVHVVGLKGFA